MRTCRDDSDFAALAGMLQNVTLDPRYVTLQRELGWYWTAGTPMLGWWSYRWAEVEYRHMSYDVDDDVIEIRSGVFWQSVQNVPRSRVQHTDVSQGPLERKHGLGRLVIFTAGTQHSRVELPGLAHHTALDIRDRLLPRHTVDVV
jgi:hypothetical protein